MKENDKILENHYKIEQKSEKSDKKSKNNEKNTQTNSQKASGSEKLNNSEKTNSGEKISNNDAVKNNFPSVKNAETKQDDNKKVGKNDKSKSKVSKIKTGAIIGLSIATGILGLSTIGLGIGLGFAVNTAENYGNRLEGVYKKSFLDLVDNVNNAEINLSKVLASGDNGYQKKMLSLVSDNASDAQVNLSSLPLSQSSLNDVVSLLNQLGGYSKTLNEKLAQGESLAPEQVETLDKLHSVIVDIKAQLNSLAVKIREGYKILDESLNVSDNDNNFTIELSKIRSVDVEYPTMIYDGPFSDSVTNVPVKGLVGKKVSKEEARNKIEKMFKNIVSLDFEQDTQGRFETFNYRLKNSDQDSLYIQVTQIGGHILTVSGASGGGNSISLDIAAAQEMAVDFAKNNGIENPLVVWSDEIGDQMYFNIAPTQNGIVLYPDLVKVKIDLTNGTVVGYDATTYFTNHVKRDLPAATFDMDKARTNIPSQFVIKSERTVLAPIDYNRQVLCYEFACESDGSEYYFYVNARTGKEENILRVINTENGNKLM